MDVQSHRALVNECRCRVGEGENERRVVTSLCIIVTKIND
jgi:hypothetical protein